MKGLDTFKIGSAHEFTPGVVIDVPGAKAFRRFKSDSRSSNGSLISQVVVPFDGKWEVIASLSRQQIAALGIANSD
ncbi:hypothetical protein EOA33_14900 [Mesorhizobium sp. M4A.F.Ca.ET.050.02.1.1]|uniref:hypothetical protein n=1 Tax=Mesorhizobium sp. M4A.F.Ca.ET.050.02.1.1 TaxID=2496754 RepID=UPI000FCAA5D4|nr:hypothetical protein [Mesorhizobium sp. M4A.F.Ca.ET.050.02.1.1]RUX48651.1 hypothetical protein EOA33_14900 [Mesorhizobium sp. M4A.F.Ca.ET.050.02.1.1]